MSPKPLRILCIGHPYILAINRSVAREIARDPDFEVTVATPKNYPGDLRSLELELEPPGSPLRLVGLDARWSRRIHVFHLHGTALRALLADRCFDAVYVWEEPYIAMGWQIVRAAKMVGLPVVFRTAQNLLKRYPPPFSWFERQTVKRADAWFACGQLVFDTVLQRGYNPAAGRRIPLAVDTASFRPLSLEDRQAVLREVGLTPPVVGFLGRLIPAKGLGVLRSALEKLSAAQPWSLLCLGSGPEENVILEWAKAHGWADRVRVRLVKHHEVPRYLGALDVLAAPSRTTPAWREQFGRMIVEAFACKVPVLGSDSGEIPYVVGEAGMIVPEADADAWSAALAGLLADPARREALAEAGERRVEEYSARHLAGEYRRFFHELLAVGN